MSRGFVVTFAAGLIVALFGLIWWHTGAEEAAAA